MYWDSVGHILHLSKVVVEKVSLVQSNMWNQNS